MNLKENLKDVLSEEEMGHLKTSFDIIGDIAIMEIDDELVSKEKEIAEALLKLHKNINVVCKKSGIHSGTFRTQDLVVLAGENRKETISKENNVQIKLDAENVYFSPRLSTDRKRIAAQLKKNEKILAMFSGSGPYPMVMLRNEPTVNITSVEINPVGVKYQHENLIINKSIVKKIVPKFRKENKEFLKKEMARKVRIYEGDVRKVVDNLPGAFVGLKCALDKDQIKGLIRHKKQFVELHLRDGDIEQKEELLNDTIRKFDEKGIDVVIHAPENKYNDSFLDLYSKDEGVVAVYNSMLTKFNELLRRYSNLIGFVLHPCNYISEKRETDINIFKKNIMNIKGIYPELFEYLYFENLVVDFYSRHDILEVAEIANICFDINHFYCVYPDNNKLAQFVEKLVSTTNVYFHIGDSDGHAFNDPHCLEIGKGEVDFARIAKYIDFGAIEVISKDYSHPDEMYNSYKQFMKIRGLPKFNRILMPLPKSAEEFLPTALKVAKKGTMVHFYDFLHVDDFDQAREKIDKACTEAGLKYNIVELVKCGQHAPRVFRICVDFKIL